MSEDRLQAWIVREGPAAAGLAALTVDEVLAVAKRERIAITDAVRSRAAELLAAIIAGAAAPANLPERFLLAEGCRPVDAEDGRLERSPELAQEMAKPDADDRIDYYAQRGIVTAPAGATIGRLIPPKDGTDGIDVYGNRRGPRKPKGVPFKLAGGVMLTGPGADAVVATVAGRVLVEAGKVCVVEVLDLPGDVDFSTGSVQTCVDVRVAGTVRSKFSVRTTQSLYVDRVIEAADVEAGRDITVHGGIFGQERTGRVRAGGDVKAKLFNEVDLEALGNVQFEKEILNSRVRIQGRLVGPRGTIIGGETYAREGMEVCVLGSEGCVTTCVASGTEVDTLRRVRRAERQVRELEKSAKLIRQTVKPLLANARRLLPAQRERATELLCKADEIELQIADLRQEAQRRLQEGAPQGAPEILVGEAIYPGVRVTIHTRESRVQSLMRGPVKIALRKVEDVTEVVAVNQRTGSLTVLPSIEVDLDVPPTEEPAHRGKQDETDQRVVGHHWT